MCWTASVLADPLAYQEFPFHGSFWPEIVAQKKTLCSHILEGPSLLDWEADDAFRHEQGRQRRTAPSVHADVGGLSH